MNVLAVLIVAVLTLHVGISHLLVYLRSQRHREHLFFALTCFAMVAYDLFCAGLYSAASPAEGYLWQRAQLASLGLVEISLIWFVASYSKLVGPKVLWWFTAFFGFNSLMQLFAPGNLYWYPDQPVVKVIELWPGYVITYNEVLSGPLSNLAVLMGVALFAYFFWLGFKAYRAGHRGKACPLMIASVILILGVLNDAAVMSGLYRSVYLIEYAYLSLILSMTYLMAMDVVEAARRKDELAIREAEVSQLNAELEVRVEKRTAELLEANEMLKIQIDIQTAIEEKLEEALDQIKTMSITDHLVLCYNRGYMSEHLPGEIRRAARYERNLSLIMCDIDHFKKVNDSYGHRTGDVVLQKFVSSIKGVIRANVDWIARYGGEEFVIVLPETDLRGAICLAERLRKSVAKVEIAADCQIFSVTASFGVVNFAGQGHEPKMEDLINLADQELYRAKQEGRNCVRPALEEG